MFPLFHIWQFIEVHVFGLFLVASWIVFFWLLHKNSLEHGLSRNIFWNIALYTTSILFWGRLAYIFTDWRNEKYIFIDLIEGGWIFDFLQRFLISENYNFSLAGCIFGFLLIFLWNVYRNKNINFHKGIDVIVRSFFWVGILGYIGALLWGQVYWVYFDSFFSILYTNKNSIVPIWSARFPLPIVYIVACLIGWLLVEKIRKTITVPDGFIGYVGIWFFWLFLFLWEFMSGSSDMFSSFRPYLSLNQLLSLVFISFSLVWIIKNTKI
jgi:hypothetical protein